MDLQPKLLQLTYLLLFYFEPVISQDLTLLNREYIQQVKEHQDFFQADIGKLLEKANTALGMEAVSVMDKTTVASSGDKHDYMSQGPYWWPDPEKPDGLPYIRRDGEKNPEVEGFSDKSNLHDLIDAVDKLGLAYFYTEEEKYAEKATKLLNTWFLDGATRMNPNLNFGQAIPGRTEGRGIGIIETRDLGYLLDGASLLQSSDAWTDQHQQEFTQWVSDYLHWLVTSPHGKDEAVHGNNHSTWYYVQAMAMALFTGQDSLAQSLQRQGLPIIIDNQIDADGSQPRELARTRTWDYSTMNLMAIYYFAILSEKVGQPIWDYQNQRIRTALSFLAPFLIEENRWEYPQITNMDRSRLLPVLKIAATHYPEGLYQAIFYSQYELLVDELLLRLRYP